MKESLKILVFLIMAQFAAVASFQVQAQAKKKDKTETVKYWVSMSCANCQAKVEKNIPFEKGVKGLETDLTAKTVTIKYQPAKTSPEKLEKAIQKLGFKTEIIKEEEAKK